MEQFYSQIIKLAYLVVLIPTLMVVWSAVMSSKALGGTLGKGLKKIAAGTVVYTTIIATFTYMEKGLQGILTDDQITMFFMVAALFGAVLLIMGYMQIYRIAKKLKLFTV